MSSEIFQNLLKKFMPIIVYGVVGCIATAINIGIYLLCYEYLTLPNVPSNILAWIISVLFAFILNKLYVFESRDMHRSVFMCELFKFILARLGTGLLDLLIMFIAVDAMAWDAPIWKVISNIVVIIANYLFSRFIVFRNTDIR